MYNILVRCTFFTTYIPENGWYEGENGRRKGNWYAMYAVQNFQRFLMAAVFLCAKMQCVIWFLLWQIVASRKCCERIQCKERKNNESKWIFDNEVINRFSMYFYIICNAVIWKNHAYANFYLLSTNRTHCWILCAFVATE